MPFPHKKQPTRKGKFTGNLGSTRLIYQAGAAARKNGDPIWVNPLLGEHARVWANGWRGVPHTKPPKQSKK